MGSPCQIRLISSKKLSVKFLESIANAAIAEVRRLESKYSRYLDDSVLSSINQSSGNDAPISVDEETAHLLDYAFQAFEQSSGLFDISSGWLRQIWDFKSQSIPSAEDITRAQRFVGLDKVKWLEGQLTLPEGMELDFGGYVKEYAADAAASICAGMGEVAGLVELGGDIRVVGHADRPWDIGIRNPRVAGEVLTYIRLEQGALASSGDYERYIDINGRRYSHILDPRSCWPVEAPASISVIADNCLLAGTVSTIGMLHGEVRCQEWLDEIGLPYLCVFRDGGIINNL